MNSLIKYEKDINNLLKRYGVKFGIYKTDYSHGQARGVLTIKFSL